METYRNYINGEWVEAYDGEYYDVINPARLHEVVARAPLSTELDIINAINACVKAEESWARTQAPKRGRVLYKLADLLESRVEELALILTKEEGKTLGESRGEIMHAASECRYMASEAYRLTGTVYPSEVAGGMVCRIREPLGTIAAINPWNFPVVTPIRKIAPALACGNTVLFKPAKSTPGTAVKLMELMEEAGVPPGVVNLICGSGKLIGDTICMSSEIKGITFTGSSSVGAHIAKNAGKTMTRLQLEMGGKNPAIIWDPLDMKFCAQEIAKSAFGGTGQKCTAISKVIIKSDQHDEFVEMLTAQAKDIVIGDGQTLGVTMGPLATEQQFKTVCEYMRLAHETATVHYGGERLNEVGNGWFVSPTIVTNVDCNHRLALEEVFGPFVTVIKVNDFNEAIDAANNTEYGLASCLFSKNQEMVRQYVNTIQSGMAHVNEQTFVMGHVPFGGIKNSGFGSYSNGDAVKEFYMTEKIVYFS